jgi:hypothetical protein
VWGRAIAGVVACLVGGVWVLQGADVLGGSFMSGSWLWLVIGALVLAAGAALLATALRGNRPGAA